jgi:antitoxin ParD1/3/4
MSTMNISLPEALRNFVDSQVSRRDYASSSEYVRALIRRDQERHQLRERLLEGQGSGAATPADDAYFDGLRERIKSS